MLPIFPSPYYTPAAYKYQQDLCNTFSAKLSVQLFDEMRKRDMANKYGAVTMCVGTGQGACGIFEFLN